MNMTQQGKKEEKKQRTEQNCDTGRTCIWNQTRNLTCKEGAQTTPPLCCSE
ncbi:hypothetical protein EXN66_Car015375 [Channa argus]|uniref:Uncharacterized protein n=1 Tax=Channa argus TaxID=215402 RepID=A0A6G1QBP1_CHAAH|nr:hypothetical protein EXN66_Car015375 [Channa argus]